jgi:2-(3-amino-3-carboxypropyl)histidine synthase
MDAFFIQAKAVVKIGFPKSYIKRLPKNLCLATTAQFVNQLSQFKKFLESNGKKVAFVKGKHAKFPGQILGCSCSELKYPKSTDAFLYIGDGDFHPKALLLGSDKPVYTFNPFNNEFKKMAAAAVAAIKKKTKVALTKFLHAKNIGVILSTKPGQMQLSLALNLKKRFPEKNFYYLVSNTIDFQQLENFTFVDCFVNTACNRLIDDYEKFPKPVVNIGDLE